jgi:hypothetical protein
MFKRQARRLLATGKVSSYAKGEIVVRLTTLYHEEEDAIEAAEKTQNFEEAQNFLGRECELCYSGALKPKNVVTMMDCDHFCCRECAAKHFTVVLKDRNVSDATCPFCGEPSGLAKEENDDKAAEYFAKLV